MNAYEMADELDGWSDHWLSDKGEDDVFKAHATMLRQQADRIAKLEKDLHMIERHYDQLDKDVSSKPVAWMQTFTQVKGDVELVKHAVNIEQVGINDIPLYTHPVKQLSDEEIEQIAKNYLENMENDSWYGKAMGIPEDSVVGFARAIIKEITE